MISFFQAIYVCTECMAGQKENQVETYNSGRRARVSFICFGQSEIYLPATLENSYIFSSPPEFIREHFHI